MSAGDVEPLAAAVGVPPALEVHAARVPALEQVVRERVVVEPGPARFRCASPPGANSVSSAGDAAAGTGQQQHRRTPPRSARRARATHVEQLERRNAVLLDQPTRCRPLGDRLVPLRSRRVGRTRRVPQPASWRRQRATARRSSPSPRLGVSFAPDRARRSRRARLGAGLRRRRRRSRRGSAMDVGDDPSSTAHEPLRIESDQAISARACRRDPRGASRSSELWLRASTTAPRSAVERRRAGHQCATAAATLSSIIRPSRKRSSPNGAGERPRARPWPASRRSPSRSRGSP